MDNTVALLTGINVNVKAILDSMNMVRSQSAAERAAKTVSSLSTAGAKEGINLADSRKNDVGNMDLSAARGKETSIAELVKLLNDIPSAVKAIAGIKSSTIKGFEKNVGTIIKSLDSIVEKYNDGNPKMIKSMSELFKSLNGLTDFVKACSKMTAAMIPAKVGLKLLSGFFDEFGKLITKISNVRNINKAVKTLNQMGKVIDSIVKIVGKTALTVGIMALTGLVIAKAFPMILLGFAGITAALIGIALVMGLAGKIAMKSALFQFSIKEVIKLYMMSAGIIVVSALMGALITVAWDVILLGFSGMAAMMFGIIGVNWLIGLVAANKELFTLNIKSVMMMYLMSAVLIMTSVLVGMLVMEHYGKIAVGFLAMSGVILGTAALTKLIAKVAHDKDMMTAAKNILLVEGALGAAAIVILAAVGVSKVIENAYGDAAQASVALLGMFGLMSAIVLAAAGLAKIASEFGPDVKKGAVALLLMEGVLLAANVVTLAILGTSKLAEGHWDQIWLTFASMTGMVTAIGLLAAGAGAIAGMIMPGVGALALVELLIAGMSLVTAGLIKLHQYREESGAGWDDLFLDITAMGGMAGEFAVLAGLLGLAVVPVTVGLASAALLAGFVRKLESIVMAAGNMHKVIAESGGADLLSNTMNRDLPKILKSFTMNNLSFGLKDLAQVAKLSVMCTAVAHLAGKMAYAASAIGKIARIGGMITPDGGIRPVVGKDVNGDIKYGEPVDLSLVANTIGGAIKAFVNQCDYDMKDIFNMMKASQIFEMVGAIIDPVDKFVKMVTGYVSGGEGILSPLYVDKDGKLVPSGIQCDIVAVATTIGNGISSFVSQLYSEENITKWIEYTQGKKNGSLWEGIRTAFGGDSDATRAIKEMGNILGVIITPVSDFVKMISGFGTSGNGTLHTVSMDSDGKVINGPDIDIAAISGIIVSGVSSFVDLIYDPDRISHWVTLSTSFDPDKIMNPIRQMMDLVAQFSDTKKYNPGSIDAVNKSAGSLISGLYKQITAIDTKKIDVFRLSISSLSKTLGNFDKVLKTDADNRKKRLEELKNLFKDISSSLNGASESLSGFTGAMGSIQNMDTSKMREKLNAVAAGISSVNKASQGMQSGTVSNKTENLLQSAMYEAVSRALSEIFDGATLQEHSQGGRSKFILDVQGGGVFNK